MHNPVEILPYPPVEALPEIEAGIYDSEISDKYPPALRCHVNKGVQDALDSGNNEFLAELRHITVLFVNLKNLTLHSEVVHIELDFAPKCPTEARHTQGR